MGAYSPGSNHPFYGGHRFRLGTESIESRREDGLSPYLLLFLSLNYLQKIEKMVDKYKMRKYYNLHKMENKGRG